MANKVSKKNEAKLKAYLRKQNANTKPSHTKNTNALPESFPGGNVPRA